ncbi:putative sodium/calcium exchanger 7 [Halotydeus destructor]|nr:putative sodium/calcium exchanger 7 [Halotydeus destructor]
MANWTLSEAALLLECTLVNNFNSTAEQCSFISNTLDCEGHGGFLNYLELFYCTIGATGKALPLLASSLVLLLFFIGLGVTADDFLCPSLLVISKHLRLSQNVAGVTFLAFGNGAPDIFSSMAGVQNARPHLVLGELFGAGIFVTTVVAGAVLLTQNFKSMERPLLRDILFYMISTFLTWCIFFSGSVHLWQAISFIVIYVVYILVVIGGRIVYNRQRQDVGDRLGSHNDGYDPGDDIAEETEKKRTMSSLEVPSPLAINGGRHIHTVSGKLSAPHAILQPRNSLPNSIANGNSLGLSPATRPRTASHSRYPVHNHFNNALFAITHDKNEDGSCQDINCLSNSIDHDITITSGQSFRTAASGSHRSNLSHRSSIASQVSHLNQLPEWKEFLIHVCPIDIMNWSDMSGPSRAFAMFKSPLYFLLIITTPVVDYESNKNNWCRLLNCIHCVTGPMILLVLLDGFGWNIGVVPVYALALGIGFLLAILIFLTSTNDEPPCFHWLFGYLGFLVSVLWIYALANETVSLLHAVGVLLSLSDSILGLTVLAWGNSIGDLVSNVSMARQGFPRMAISACFGGPLMNLLLGFGLPYTIGLSDKGGPLQLTYTKMTSLLYATSTLCLMTTVVFMVLNKFEAKKSHGIFLITIYIIYMTLAILIESQLL